MQGGFEASGKARAGAGAIRGGYVFSILAGILYRRGQGVPIRRSEEMGDQLQALGDPELEAFLRGELLAEHVGHALGIAIVAHGGPLRNEGRMSGARVTDPLVRAKGFHKFDTFTIPLGGASGRPYQPDANVRQYRLACQS